ncbi:hypothetical protein [Microbacterium sp. SS28]|uniref:hypothetical protein n=1 Tax=Microbacterium sp. SS28 TaxID=2919948 RepID=UPI001FAB22CE|nr:hypothetical protein [Microbacterium sp. SS28]
MSARPRLGIGALVLVAAVSCAACATVPDPPAAVGEDYPGTCMPSEFSWPTDFLESLPGESSAVGGSIVGLRLEYVDAEWVWRLRSADTRSDVFGDRVDDPSAGRESLVDVRTLETLATHEVELTEAEQQTLGTGAYDAAQLSGEQWPSPLIIEMARVMEGGTAMWRITTCDTATNEHFEMTLN